MEGLLLILQRKEWVFPLLFGLAPTTAQQLHDLLCAAAPEIITWKQCQRLLGVR
jgi:hypothetical protein